MATPVNDLTTDRNRAPSPSLPAADKDLGELLQAVVKDASELVGQEAKLLKREVEVKVDLAQSALAVGAVGAVAALLTLSALTATMIIALSLVLDLWLASLLVTAFWGIVSLAAVSWAKTRFAAESLRPKQTERSVQRDVRALEKAT